MQRNKPEYPEEDLNATGQAKHYSDWVLSYFRPYICGRVGEVGAGLGLYTAEILKMGITDIVAFEPAPNLFHILRQKFADSKQVKLVNDYFSAAVKQGAEQCDGQFDSIVYINVLEHVEKDDHELEVIYHSLSSGGHLLVFVPALPFLYSRYDRYVGHFRRYTKKTLQQKMKAAGFRVTHIQYFDSVGIFPWYIFCKLLKQFPSEATVSFYDKWVVPLERWFEKMFPPLIGKNLIVIAEKQ